MDNRHSTQLISIGEKRDLRAKECGSRPSPSQSFRCLDRSRAPRSLDCSPLPCYCLESRWVLDISMRAKTLNELVEMIIGAVW